jgi:hypothetical protein
MFSLFQILQVFIFIWYICNSIKLNCEEKWTEALNVILIRKETYSLPFITTKSSKLQWFQYRIIHRILGTNSLLYKISKKPNDKCSFCSEVERIEHIFWSCKMFGISGPFSFSKLLIGIFDFLM